MDPIKTAVEAVKLAERALNEALADLALETVHSQIETGQAIAVNGFPRQWVKVSAWRRTDLL